MLTIFFRYTIGPFSTFKKDFFFEVEISRIGLCPFPLLRAARPNKQLLDNLNNRRICKRTRPAKKYLSL